jgi:hypothetical protein
MRFVNYLSSLIIVESNTKNIEDARSSLSYLHVLREKLHVLRVPLCNKKKLIVMLFYSPFTIFLEIFFE